MKYSHHLQVDHFLGVLPMAFPDEVNMPGCGKHGFCWPGSRVPWWKFLSGESLKSPKGGAAASMSALLNQ